MSCAGLASLTLIASAFAQSDTGPLEEIIITAQKREEAFGDVAVAVSVVTGATLESRNVANISDINKIVPSVNFSESLSGRNPWSIRGISAVSNQQSIGISSGVLLQIDGVPWPSDSFGAVNIDDVERIEVLKGPQSTLGGRVASSGSVNVVTRGPTDEFSASVSALYTDDGEYKITGFVGGPMGETFAGSLSAWTRETERLQTNIMTGQATTSGNTGARGKLQFAPSDAFDATLSVRTQNYETNGSHFVYDWIDPGANFLSFIAGGQTQEESVPGRMNGENIYFHDPRANRDNLNMDSIDGLLELNWQLNNDTTLSSLTSYLDEDRVTKQSIFIVNNFFTQTLLEPNIPIYTVVLPLSGYSQYEDSIRNFNNEQIATYKIRQTTQEFKIVSPGGQRVDYVAGVFYSDLDIDLNFDRALFLNFQDISVNSRTKSLGVYGRVTFNDVISDVDLLLGARYNDDKISHHNDQRAYGMFDPMNPGSLTYDESGSTSDTTVVGDITARWHVNDDSMVYATYARGYKPAAYDTGAQIMASTPLPLQPAPKETVNHFEVGSKGVYADGRFALNVAVFDTVYKDFQAQTFFGTSVPRPLVLKTAGEAETKGVEVDGTWAATDNFQLGFAAALIHAEWNDFKDGPCYPTQDVLEPAQCMPPANPGEAATQDLSGKPMPKAPEFKYNVNAEQVFELSSVPFDMALYGAYSWTGDQYFNVNRNPRNEQKSYGILDLGVSFESRGDVSYRVTLFVNNALDEFYWTDAQDFFAGLWGGANVTLTQPARDATRYYGIRLNVDL